MTQYKISFYTVILSVEIKRIWETRNCVTFYFRVPVQDEIVRFWHSWRKKQNDGSSTVSPALFPFCTWTWVNASAVMAAIIIHILTMPASWFLDQTLHLNFKLGSLSADLTYAHGCLTSRSKPACLKQNLPLWCPPHPTSSSCISCSSHDTAVYSVPKSLTLLGCHRLFCLFITHVQLIPTFCPNCLMCLQSIHFSPSIWSLPYSRL